MNMIEAVRVAQTVFEQHAKQVLIRPKHFAMSRSTARTWYVINPNGLSLGRAGHVLQEVFWHPEDHLLKVLDTDMPSVDSILLDWELRQFTFQSNTIVSSEFMTRMKEAFLYAHALPSLSPIFATALQTS
jgi:hypothetical protein